MAADADRVTNATDEAAQIDPEDVSQEQADELTRAVPPDVAEDEMDTTLNALSTLVSLQSDLRNDLEKLNAQMATLQTTAEKQELLVQIEKHVADLRTTTRNVQEIAAGADITAVRATKEPEFDFQREFFSLLQPAMKEIKDMTSHLREKAEQRDKIAYYSDIMPTTERAVANLERLLVRAEDPQVIGSLEDMLLAWQKQLTFLQSELQAATLQLRKLESSEVSLAEASQGYFKTFFQNRGLYLGEAILVVVLLLVLSRLTQKAMHRWIPGFNDARRSFRVRLLELSNRIVTALLTIIGPMLVFYFNQDWLLLSVGILLLLGIGLTVRHTLPRYWQQIQLFLNVGTVREAERVDIDGMPWLVKQINFYTLLENPTADLTRRVKIDDLVDLRSRPVKKNEPWFPCKYGDWVLLSDGNRGKVIGISQELTQMVQRGGALITYLTQDFLGGSPINLSTNFRIKETIGVSYSPQALTVSSMAETLREHVEKRATDEGYGDQLLNLRVEFEKANTSSLDMVVIADFKGELAEFYNRLRRAIQRWCVEACTENNWEIPFTQITLHGSR